VSHDPGEHADDADCLTGVATLERALHACLAVPPIAG